MSKHEAWELKQMQAVPLEGKIAMTKRRIRDWYDYWNGQVYVSFSGGKDSTVLKHIVDSMYSDVSSVFVNTGLEYPEIQKFAMSQPHVDTLRPEKTFNQVVLEHGYPIVSKFAAKTIRNARSAGKESAAFKKLSGTLNYNGAKSKYCLESWLFLYDAPFKISERCCDVMKKDPLRKYEKRYKKKPMLGTMAYESNLRLKNWMQNGCNAFEIKHPQSAPMSFWTEQDILHYLIKYDVPYASIYGDIVVKKPHDVPKDQMTIADILGIEEYDHLETTGCNRTGCIFCMFGCHLEESPNRFQKLKETHPRQYDYCINGGEMIDGMWQPNKEGLGLGYVLDYIGVDYM